jgi:hypothetical protein
MIIIQRETGLFIDDDGRKGRRVRTHTAQKEKIYVPAEQISSEEA